MKGRSAAIVTDVQGDFTEWKKGSLAVPGSDESYVLKVEEATRRLRDLGLVILGTQDWHPQDHVSFAINHPGRKPFEVITVDGRSQVLWPPHCIQGTENARVLIDNNVFLAVVKKAQSPHSESYSAFRDEGGLKTEMDAVLKINGVTNLFIYGLATDYCVKATALDAVSGGYSAIVIEELCRGITPAGSIEAVAEMRKEGVRVVYTLDEVIGEIAG
jgi:nicotinamidase/pyrazinamidase